VLGIAGRRKGETIARCSAAGLIGQAQLYWKKDKGEGESTRPGAEPGGGRRCACQGGVAAAWGLLPDVEGGGMASAGTAGGGRKSSTTHGAGCRGAQSSRAALRPGVGGGV
jgi:hypothetical protein